MDVSRLMIYTIAVFMVAGALDKLLGSRFGLGQDFDRGLLFMGTTAVPIAGAVAIMPLISDSLTPLVTPLYQWFGAEPAMLAGTLLASDMGAHALAVSMAGDNNPAGPLAGLILGSTLGVTFSYSLPLMLGIVPPKDSRLLGQGILIGIGTIPLGVFIGGMIAGYELSWLLVNLLPVVLLSALVMIGQIAVPRQMLTGFLWLGKTIQLMLTAAFVCAVITRQTGLVIIPALAPIDAAIPIMAAIGFTMAGALPLVRCLGCLLKKPMAALSGKMGINEPSTLGLIASLASNVAMLALLPDMNARGKVANIAFSVSAQSSIGALFGFVATMDATMLPAVLAAKLTGGSIALGLALWSCRKHDFEELPVTAKITPAPMG